MFMKLNLDEAQSILKKIKPIWRFYDIIWHWQCTCRKMQSCQNLQ